MRDAGGTVPASRIDRAPAGAAPVAGIVQEGGRIGGIALQGAALPAGRRVVVAGRYAGSVLRVRSWMPVQPAAPPGGAMVLETMASVTAGQLRSGDVPAARIAPALAAAVPDGRPVVLTLRGSGADLAVTGLWGSGASEAGMETHEAMPGRVMPGPEAVRGAGISVVPGPLEDFGGRAPAGPDQAAPGAPGPAGPGPGPDADDRATQSRTER